MENNKAAHWENVFATKAVNEVSWFQEKPESSIQLIQSCRVAKEAKIIDVGGGDSYLIDNLIALGYTNLTLLDISEKAIEKAKNRLAEHLDKVTFVVSNSLDFCDKDAYAIWHDRASFHFLTDENEVQKYKSNVLDSLKANGNLILATFSEEGPEKCSGLNITQYSVEKLETIFGEAFELENCFTEEHTTPFDTVQDFIFCHYKKI